jgi:hypothetical protein
MLHLQRTEVPLTVLGDSPDPQGEGVEPWLDFFYARVQEKRAAGFATKVTVTVAVSVAQRMLGENAPPYYQGDPPVQITASGSEREYLKVMMDGELSEDTVVIG